MYDVYCERIKDQIKNIKLSYFKPVLEDLLFHFLLLPAFILLSRILYKVF